MHTLSTRQPGLSSRLLAAISWTTLAAGAVAQTGDYTLFGAPGCAGSSGAVPTLAAAAGSSPVLGSPFRIDVANLPRNIADSAFLIVALSRFGTSVPLDGAGMPGCALSIPIESLTPLFKSGTTASSTIQIPTDARLIGLRFYNQVLAFDRPFPPATQPNAYGAVVSQAAVGTIGFEVVLRSIVETFDDGVGFDERVSSARWRLGTLSPGPIGGDGVHGEFSEQLLPLDANGIRVWDTDRAIVVPSADTLLQQGDLTIAQGSASFSRFELRDGTTIRFVGSVPPVLRVSGHARIEGRLDVSGEAATTTSASVSGGLLGLEPGRPGPGGGLGGRGADAWLPDLAPPFSTPTSAYRGQDGEDIATPASSAWSGLGMGTGGQGGPLFPASGLLSDVRFDLMALYSGQQIPGGAGGGFFSAGQPGSIPLLMVPGDPSSQAAPTSGGRMVPIPLPGASSLAHFLVGGSGGGGGGSASTFVRRGLPAAFQRFSNGAGGGSGGGAIAMQVGRDLVLAPSGSIAARGGSAIVYLDASFSVRGTSAAGGGSGGSVLLQVAGRLDHRGSIDLRGGSGGVHQGQTIRPFGGFGGESRGGDGGDGLLRREVDGSVVLQGEVLSVRDQPPVAPINETEPRSVARSQWYSMLPPAGVRTTPLAYEIVAMIDGVRQVYSDDPTISGLSADVPGQPVQILVQRAPLDPATGQPTAGTSAWKDRLGDLVNDPGNGLRFIIFLDRSSAQSIEVLEVKLHYQG